MKTDSPAVAKAWTAPRLRRLLPTDDLVVTAMATAPSLRRPATGELMRAADRA